jgi:exonuclease VII large subunit
MSEPRPYERADDLATPSVTDDLATPEQLAELRGQEQVWLTLLHQATAQLGNLASYPHSRLCRAALEASAEHTRAAEKLLRALDDVLDPKQSDHSRDLSTRHLRQRVEREQQTLSQAN